MSFLWLEVFLKWRIASKLTKVRLNIEKVYCSLKNVVILTYNLGDKYMKTNYKAAINQDDEELKFLQKSAKRGSDKAKRVSKAMGLTVKLISNNEIIEKSPNGEQKVLRKINVIATNRKGLKKGTVLCKK